MYGDLAVEAFLTPVPLREAYAELLSRRDDLRVQNWILGSPRLQFEWLNSIGVTREPELAALIRPMPPVELRRITAATDAETFLWSGFVDVCNFIRQFEAHHRLPSAGERTVLDFGCGCGRLTRILDVAPTGWRVQACDINPDHVAWCAANLLNTETKVNGLQPPLPFADASVDFAYSLSVFSHLPADQATLWLADLARVVRPGGVVLLTTHGETALNTIDGSTVHQEMFRLTRDDIAAVREELARSGYAYRRLDRSVTDVAKVGDDYGNVFTGEKYVSENWAGGDLEFCAYLSGGLRGWQDIAILRKRD